MTNQSSSQSVAFDPAWMAPGGILHHSKHIWTVEQQTGHRVCAWCSACDESDCDHYWKKREDP